MVKNDYKVWNYEYNKGRRTKNKFLKIWETNKNIFYGLKEELFKFKEIKTYLNLINISIK